MAGAIAPLQVVHRELARLAAHGIKRGTPSRCFHVVSKQRAAQNYAMPALSPTMTEGSIAKWNVKEGDSFSAGDVLLEVETDKASMDVEAQDDGILAKITQPGGSKGIKVGARIAVLAEPEDDLASLEIPAEESSSAPRDDKAAAEKSSTETTSPNVAEQKELSGSGAKESAGKSVPGKAQKQIYPLYPSVTQLLHEKGLDLSEADKIPATGPSGRLLKGDVLAYLGSIQASYPLEQSQRLAKLGHLDLSNIKIAPPKKSVEPPRTAQEGPVLEEELETEFAVAISFKAVREVQQRIQKTLGIDVPLRTFISRAIEISNTDLPRADRAPTADELFNDVLGLDNVDRSISQGSFTPQIMALPPPSSIPQPSMPKQADIIDLLAGQSTIPRRLSVPAPSTGPEASNVFSISVSRADQKRARVFLERVKTILQVDPGRLVL